LTGHRTVAAVRARGWEIVRLRRRSKKPDAPKGHPWTITADADEAARWLVVGFNLGLVCHQRTGMAALDPDEMLGWADMVDVLGQPFSDVGSHVRSN
jgi:hypothetical protein